MSSKLSNLGNAPTLEATDLLYISRAPHAGLGTSLNIVSTLFMRAVSSPVVDNTIPRFDGTVGYTLQSSALVIDDANNLRSVNSLSVGTSSVATAKVDIDSGALGANSLRIIGSTATTLFLNRGGSDTVSFLSVMTSNNEASAVNGWGWFFRTNNNLQLQRKSDSASFSHVMLFEGGNGHVGIGSTAASSPGSLLSVAAGVSIGATNFTVAAPSNGLLVQGNVYIGQTTGTKPLDIASSGGIRINRTDNQSANNELLFAGNGQLRSVNNTHRIIFDTDNNNIEFMEFGEIIFSSGATTGISTTRAVLASTGNFTIGAASGNNLLNVAAGASIGAGYTSVTAPTNGLLVQGNVAIGRTSATAALDVEVAAATTTNLIRFGDTTKGFLTAGLTFVCLCTDDGLASLTISNAGPTIGDASFIADLSCADTFTTTDAIVTGLLANRLMASGGTGALVSVPDLTAWIAGTDNQIIMADNGNGTLTISSPQDSAPTSSPTFAGLTLSGLSQNSVVFAGAAGVLSQDNTNFTFNNSTDTLNATNITSTSITASGTLALSTLATASIPFVAAAGALTEDQPNLGWDNVNKRLLVGTTTGIASVSIGNAFTGLDSPSANALQIMTTNATCLFFDSNNDTYMQGNTLYLQSVGDTDHALRWAGTGALFASTAPDGPVLFGQAGGILGTTESSEKIAIQWDDSQVVTIPGTMVVGSGSPTSTDLQVRNTVFTNPLCRMEIDAAISGGRVPILELSTSSGASTNSDNLSLDFKLSSTITGFISSEFGASGSPYGDILIGTSNNGTLGEKLRITGTGNFGFNGVSFGSGVGVLFIADVGTAPTSNPSGGMVLYIESNTIKYRDTAGNIETVAVV